MQGSASGKCVILPESHETVATRIRVIVLESCQCYAAAALALARPGGDRPSPSGVTVTMVQFKASSKYSPN